MMTFTKYGFTASSCSQYLNPQQKISINKEHYVGEFWCIDPAFVGKPFPEVLIKVPKPLRGTVEISTSFFSVSSVP